MKLLYRLVYNLAIYGIVLHKANCFKSEFNYVDQIFLNTSEWIFETTFDHEKFSQVVDSSQEDCVKIIDELDLLYTNLEDIDNVNENSTKYFILTDNVTHEVAQEQCHKSGPSCKLATVSDRHTFDRLAKLLIESKVENGHIHYQAKNGKIYDNNKNLVDPSNYIFTHYIEIISCPKKYKLINGNCLRPLFSLTDRHDSEKLCKQLNSEIFELKTKDDYRALSQMDLSKSKQEGFWLGGEYELGTFPTSSDTFCQKRHSAKWWPEQQPTGEKYLYWLKDYNCLDDSDLDYENNYSRRKYHTICRTSPFHTYHAKEDPNELQKLLHDHFENVYGSFQISSEGTLKLSYQDSKAAAICSCKVHAELSQSQNFLKQNLLAKIAYVKSSIKQKCDKTIAEIKNNPYISSVDNKKKRFIGSAVKAEINSAKYALRS